MDLVGPINQESGSDDKYLLVMIDPFTHFVWIEVISQKDAKTVYNAFVRRILLEEGAPRAMLTLIIILQCNPTHLDCSFWSTAKGRTTAFFSIFGSRVSAVMARACEGFYLLGTLRIVVVVVERDKGTCSLYMYL